MMVRRSIRKLPVKDGNPISSVDNRTIAAMFDRYIDMVRLARSEHTARTYLNGLNKFGVCLAQNDLDPATTPIQNLAVDTIAWFADSLKEFSPATETLYLTAVTRFFEYLAAEEVIAVNLPRVRLLIQQRSRRPGHRLPQFPRGAIDEILEKADQLANIVVEDVGERLRNLRDRAFLVTLADTGLRVHEACNLRRGDIDWYESKAIVLGKGNREAVVRFSARSVQCLKDYLAARSPLDGSSGRPLTALPLFARHDRGAGKKIKPITPTTGRNIVTERVSELLGEAAVGSITPHSFRHYFVTRVLSSSGNLKLAQELARHRNIAVTQRYAHLSDDELDKGYWTAIEERPTK
jgi:site-specific recombinase XerD